MTTTLPTLDSEKARQDFLNVTSASITAVDIHGVTETNYFNGANLLTVVYDPSQPQYKAAYHNTEHPDEYVIVFNREYFTANYAQKLAHKKDTTVTANPDGSYTLTTPADPTGTTYTISNGIIMKATGVNPDTQKTWSTDLKYQVTEAGLDLLSQAINNLSK